MYCRTRGRLSAVPAVRRLGSARPELREPLLLKRPPPFVSQASRLSGASGGASKLAASFAAPYLTVRLLRQHGLTARCGAISKEARYLNRCLDRYLNTYLNTLNRYLNRYLNTYLNKYLFKHL